MMDFALEQHDLALNNGDLMLCQTDVDTVAQAISIRLKTFFGEWFLDENRGLPYLSHIFGKKLNERYLKMLLSQEIKAVEGVRDVDNLAIAPKQDRSLLISFTAIFSDQKSVTLKQTIGV